MGWSMGVNTAFELAVSHPERVSGIFAVAGVPGDTFATMLGLIRGRVYYNLESWYRALQLLPGYKFNAEFMEQMMGVKETLPDELAAQQTPPGRQRRPPARDKHQRCRGRD